VPRYRLEAWQAGDRMPNILQHVFEARGLREPPWTCLVPRKGACHEDIAFWVDRRRWQVGTRMDGRRIYGDDLAEDKSYDLVPLDPPSF
jgi:hypothetical protein